MNSSEWKLIALILALFLFAQSQEATGPVNNGVPAGIPLGGGQGNPDAGLSAPMPSFFPVAAATEAVSPTWTGLLGMS